MALWADRHLHSEGLALWESQSSHSYARSKARVGQTHLAEHPPRLVVVRRQARKGVNGLLAPARQQDTSV